MAYRPVLRIALGHAYWGAEPPPLTLHLADPEAVNAAGALVRSKGAEILIVSEHPESVPRDIILEVRARDALVFSVTALPGSGHERAIPQATLTVDGDTDTVAVDLAGAPTIPRQAGSRTLCQLRVHRDGAEADVTVTLPTVETRWIYHLVGRAKAANPHVVDSRDAITFDIAEGHLPDRTEVSVQRASAMLPLSARPAPRFRLDGEGSFGPVTLIPVLPGAGPDATPDRDDPTTLNSNIYVNLW